MENNAMSIDATTKAYNSQNSAIIENEKNLSSIEGRINILSTVIQEKWNNALSSDVIKGFVSGITVLIESFGNIQSVVGLATTAILLFKGKAISGLLTDLIAVTAGESAMSLATIGLTSAFNALKTAFLTNPLGMTALAITGLVGGFVLLKNTIFDTEKAVANQKKKVDELKTGYNELKTEIDNLKGVKNPTEEQSAYLKLLERELELKQQILDQEKSKLIGKEIFGEGVFGKGMSGDVQKNIDSVNEIFSAIKYTQEEISRIQAGGGSAQQDIDHLNDLRGQLKEVELSFINNKKTLEEYAKVAQGSAKQGIDNLISSIDGILPKLQSENVLVEKNTETKKENEVINTESIYTMKSLSDVTQDLAKSIQDATDDTSKINKVLEQHAKTGEWDAKTILELSEKYPALLEAMNDDKELTETLQSAKDDLANSAFSRLDLEIQAYEKQFEIYGIDAKNFENLENAKTLITRSALSERMKMYQNEMNVINASYDQLRLKAESGNLTDSERTQWQNLQRGGMYVGSKIGETQSTMDQLMVSADKYLNLKALRSGVGKSLSLAGTSDADGKQNKQSQSLTIENANTYSSIIDTQNSLLSQQDSLLSKISDTISQQVSSNQLTEAISTQNQLYTEQQKKLDLLYQTRDKYTNAEQSVIDAFSSNGWLDGQDIYSMNQQDFDKIYDSMFAGKDIQFGIGEQAEKDKQAFQDRANLFKSLSSEWLKLKDAMGKTNDDIGKMAYDMNKTLVEMDKNVLESYNKNLEASSKNLTEKMKDLDLQLKQLDEGDLKGSSDILSKKLKLANDELKLRENYLNQLKGTVTSSVEGEIELQKAIESASDAVREQKGTVIDLQKSMKDSLDNQKKLVEDTESKIVDIIKNSIEKQKKAIKDKYDNEKKLLDEKYNNEKNTLDKIQELYNRSNSSDDYEKNLKKEKEVANNIDAQITDAMLNQSPEGQKKLRALQAQKVAQQEKIDQMVLERTRETNNQMFDDMKSSLDKQHEEQTKIKDDQYEKDIKRIDDLYTEAQIRSIAHQAILDGSFKNMQGNIVSVAGAFKDFAIESGDSIVTLVDRINEFTTSLKSARDIINSMGSMNLSANISTDGINKGYKDGGIITQNQIAMLHGSPSNPELVTNGAQAVNLLRNLSFNPINSLKAPTMTPISKQSSGVTFNEPFMVIQGNVDNTVMPELNSVVDKAVAKISSMTKRENNNRGQFARP